MIAARYQVYMKKLCLPPILGKAWVNTVTNTPLN